MNKQKPTGLEITKEKLLDAIKKSTQKSFALYESSEAKSVVVKVPI